MTPALEIRSVTRSFDETPVFADVSFIVGPGRHLALLGPSGCGKSTLLQIIAGLDAPDIGDVRIAGVLVSDSGRILVPPHERGVAMVFQDLALWPNLHALANVELGLAGQRLNRKERRDRAREALQLAEVESLAERRPSQLSIGQQQRVALARAIAVRPRLLLLDEAFSSLDLGLKAQLSGVVLAMCTQAAVTCVIVTHDPLDAAQLAGDAVVLEDGGILEAGPIRELSRAPVSETMRSFSKHLSLVAAKHSGDSMR